MPRKTRRTRGGGFPTTSWGNWSAYPGALAWSSSTQAPPPLANGGQYAAPQSTGACASTPFPATLYGWQVEAARTANNPDVFFHQRPNDNMGASFSPYVGTPLSPLHYAAMYKPQTAGRRRRRATKKRLSRK